MYELLVMTEYSGSEQVLSHRVRHWESLAVRWDSLVGRRRRQACLVCQDPPPLLLYFLVPACLPVYHLVFLYRRTDWAHLPDLLDLPYFPGLLYLLVHPCLQVHPCLLVLPCSPGLPRRPVHPYLPSLSIYECL
jgi:hypothetical protein